ncbi:MAG: hypothetical protein N3A38_04745, partial [Planctomycetota bacterium]|nr:hypothetical protein [Planctomycetota bacterium]
GKVSGPEPCDVDAALAWALQPPPPKIPPAPDKSLENPAVPARPPDRPGPDPVDIRWDGGPVTLAEALGALHATRGIGFEIPPSAAEAAGRQLSVCISSPMPLREAVAWMARSCRLSVSWREPDPAAAEGPSRPVAVLSVPADPGKGWEQAPFEPWPDEISREMSVPAPDSLALRAPVADHIRAIGRAAGINVAVDAVDFSRGGEPVSPLETAASPGRVPVVSCGEALRLILEPFGAEAVWTAPMLYVARTGTIERISERDWLFDVGNLTGRQGEGADRKAAALIGLIKFLGPKTSGGEPVCTDRAAVAGGFLRIRTSRSGRDAVRSILRSIRTAGERPDVPDLSVVLTGDIRPRRVSGIGVLATEAAGRTGLRIRLGCPDVEFPPQALYFREAGIGDALQWACDISGMQVVADGEDLVIRPASDPRGAGSLWAVPLRDPAAAKGRAAIQDLTGALRERLLLHRPFLMRGAFLAPFLDCLVVAGTGRQASVAFEEAAAMKDAMARGLPPLHNDRRAALDRALALRPAAAPERLQGRFRDLLRGIIGPQTSATILVEPSAMRRVAETVVELDTKDKTCGRIVGELAAAAGLEMLIENGVVLLAEPEKR